MYGILLIIERLFLGKLLKKNPVKIINWIYTMFAVMIAWIYFRSEDIFQAHEYIGQLFNFSSQRYSPVAHLSMQVLIVIALAILFSGFVQRPVKALIRRMNENGKIPTVISSIVKGGDLFAQIAILILSIMALISGTHNVFIYFQF
jgi:alginate O-acetyltransferase complex protein AlgI